MIHLEPIKQPSSIITGAAWTGSSTPPSPPSAQMDIFTHLAQEPTVAQVSTIVPWSTYAPMFINEGIITTPLAIKEPYRAIALGTTLIQGFYNPSSGEFYHRTQKAGFGDDHLFEPGNT